MSTAESTTFADNIKTLGDSLVNMKVLEVLQLTKYLKETHNLEAAAVAVAPAGAGGGRCCRRGCSCRQDRIRRRRSKRSAPTRSGHQGGPRGHDHSGLKRPKTWWKPLPRTSRPVFPKRMPRSSRKSSKTRARPSRSSDVRARTHETSGPTQALLVAPGTSQRCSGGSFGPPYVRPGHDPVRPQPGGRSGFRGRHLCLEPAARDRLPSAFLLRFRLALPRV